MSKKSRRANESLNLKRRRQALDRTFTQDEWDEIIVNLALMAKSSNKAVAVRAAELLLRYHFGAQGEPQAQSTDVEQIKYVEVHTPAPNPNSKR